jgi:membrane fusion protein (multidrug efflux system)
MKHLLILCYLAFFSPLPAQENIVTPKTFSAIGTLFPKNTSGLSSRVTGRVMEVLVDVGDEVKKGTTLLIIDPLFFQIDVAQAEAKLSSALVDCADAELNFQRMSTLWNKQDGSSPSISKKRFEDAQVQYEQEKSQVKQAEESLKKAKALLEETHINAPYDGIITKRLIHPGESVTADSTTHLLEIEAVDTMYVEFSVPQAILSKIHIGSPLTIEAEGIMKEKRNATIGIIFPHIEEKTRSAKCRAIIDNSKKDLPSGALVKVQIELGV